jgi:hypothetical protein
MTAILDRAPRSDELPAAGWTAQSLGGPGPLKRALTADEIAAIGRAVRLVEGQRPEEISRADFDDPAIAALMADALDRVQHGPGAVILSGLDPADLGEANFTRAVAGLAAHVGTLAPQSPKRDRIGYVRKEAENPDARGYQSDIELQPHTDFHEIVALASIARAAEGGLSGLVSLAAIYDILAREDPEALALLEQGYPHDTTGDGLLSDGPMPVLNRTDGVITGYAMGVFMYTAAATLGEEVPPALTAAMKKFSAIARRPEVIVEFMLEPGEIMLWHNFRVLHSRTNFRDDESHRRLILRLWINPEEHLPMPPVYLSQRERFDALHAAGQPAIVYTKTGIKV